MSDPKSQIPASYLQTPWPRADVIIGNPPFLGAKRLKPEHGADYVNAIRKLYPEVPGMADFCVYWIRRAHDHLPACTKSDPFAGRAGLVGTQNVRNNQSRVGGLDHVVKTSTPDDAVAQAGRDIRRVRADALKITDGGLRALYRTLELPGRHPLKDAHAALDAATLATYGFSDKKDLLQQLLDLNHAVAAAEKAGQAVTSPGVPPTYGDATTLVTQDCIKP